MSSNYEWQRQYTKQRIGDAHHAAAAHRLAKSAAREQRPGLWASLAQAIGRLRQHRPAESQTAVGPISHETQVR